MHKKIKIQYRTESNTPKELERKDSKINIYAEIEKKGTEPLDRQEKNNNKNYNMQTTDRENKSCTLLS